jgi:2-phosphosulfolactate phosphatase
VFASTNGSLALRAIAGCGRRWIGAFVNASGTARALAGASHVLVVCAGKLGRFALEDAAFAGWLAAALEAQGARVDGANARLARTLAPGGADEIAALVQGASHGRYLRRLGGEFARDVEWCAAPDSIGQAFAV